MTKCLAHSVCSITPSRRKNKDRKEIKERRRRGGENKKGEKQKERETKVVKENLYCIK